MTQEFVTLPRHVAEHAVASIEMLNTGKWAQVTALAAALRTALEQPQAVTDCHQSEKPQGDQQPVAWAEEIIEYLHAHYDTEMIEELDSGNALIRLDDAIAAVEEVEQRYTHSQRKRHPLTDEQISRLWSDAHNDTTDRMAFQVLARAIEAAHNIK